VILSPLILLICTVLLLLLTTWLAQQSALGGALVMGSLSMLIFLGALAFQLALRYPGRAPMVYLGRVPLLGETASDLLLGFLPAVGLLTLLCLPVSSIMARRPLTSKVLNWIANGVTGAGMCLLVLWLFFDPLHDIQSAARSALKLVPGLGTLLQVSWLPWALIGLLTVRATLGRHTERSDDVRFHLTSLLPSGGLLLFTWIVVARIGHL
jgi:hypothetical protein